MLIDLVIAACAALAGVGTIYAGFKLFRRSPPRWLLPLIAGMAMIGVTAALRYQWADTMVARMPARLVVLDRLAERSPFEPWSLIRPVDTRILVADLGSVRTLQTHPDMLAIDVLLLRRDAPTLVARHLLDCAGRRDAILAPDAPMGEDGLPAGLDWSSDSPPGLLDAACPVAAPADVPSTEQGGQAEG